MKILIFGLPDSGKTTLANKLATILDAERLNANEIREEHEDWDFSPEGRLRQARRMRDMADELVSQGFTVIVDFVCPTRKTRKIFDADFSIFLYSINESRFEDTNQMFEKTTSEEVDWWDNSHSINIDHVADTIKQSDMYCKFHHDLQKWSSFGRPECWWQHNGSFASEIKNDEGKIVDDDKWENDFLSRSVITNETLNKNKHIIFLGDSFVFGHGLKREDDLANQFSNNINSDDYSCFNLALPGGNNTFSLLRLRQWCNSYGKKVDTVYVGISDIMRENYWPTSEYVGWDDTVYDIAEVCRPGRTTSPFFYVPSGTPMNNVFKYAHKRFEQLVSKKDSMAKLESFIVSIIHMSKTYGFNVFFFDTFDLLSDKERYLIKNFVSTHKNVIWSDIGNRSLHDSIMLDSIYKIKNDGHWNTKGARKIADTLYKKSKNWY
jgi:adenylylsulfate kinase